jgi:hypothetical protein
MVNAVERPSVEAREMATPTHQGIADRWVEGLRGNWSILEELCSSTMRVWHSFDNLWLDREESEARMADSGNQAALSELQDIRTETTERGLIVQASIESSGSPGTRTHIVQLLTVVDGMIAACEEYIAPEAAS